MVISYDSEFIYWYWAPDAFQSLYDLKFIFCIVQASSSKSMHRINNSSFKTRAYLILNHTGLQAVSFITKYVILVSLNALGPP